MCDSFKRHDHGLIFPFFRCEKMFSIAAHHLVTALIKIMKRCLLASVRQSDILPCVILISRLSHLIFVCFLKFPPVIPVNAFLHHPHFPSATIPCTKIVTTSSRPS